MIQPVSGVAFTAASDGDQRSDPDARARVGTALGIGAEWATVDQVHGDRVVKARGSGSQGRADAIITTDAPAAVFTADCLGIIVVGDGARAVIHGGWRGLASGIMDRALEVLEAAGAEPLSAYVGPHIRPCCFEVGTEVAALFPDHVARTGWGTVSVDLVGYVRSRLPVPLEDVGECTRCGKDSYSHRCDGTTKRMAAIGWIPA